MSDRKICETCGTEIPEDAPDGACPVCLLGAGLAEESPFTREQLAELLPQLEVGELLGRGGMGVVYRARQKALDRTVALKILPPDLGADAGFCERFTREARALAKLSHPNVVAVHEAGQSGDLLYLVMEYVEGVNLRQAQAAGRLPPEKALAIVPQICDALQYAHDQGVVHRDIKPENILIDRGGQVKIADFGLAKLLGPRPVDTRLTGTEQVMGTFHYLAPEQIRTPKDVDHRADIYSLGVVFYEMLTGELPIGRFPRPSERVQVDVRLDDVVLRALEQERDRRWQKASDVKTGVEGVASSCAPVPPPAPASPASNGARLNTFAVLSSLSLPVALLGALLTIAVADPAEIGILVGISVAVLGMVLAGIAVHEIRRDPARWRGLRLAKASFAVPIVLGLLFGIVAGVNYFVQSAKIEKSRRESELRMAKEAVRVFTRRAFEDLGRLGPAATLDDLLTMVPPPERERFLSLSPERRREISEAGELGLLRLLPSRLSHPLAAFEIESIDFLDEERQRASVTARCKEERVTFGVIRREGELWFDVGPAEHGVGGRSPAADLPDPHVTEAAVRGQVKEYLARLVAFDNRQGGEDVRRFVDPELNTKLISRDRDEFGPEWFEGKMGIAMFDQSQLGYPLSEFEISGVEFDEDNRGWATVTLECGDESLRFRVVSRDDFWGESGRRIWYLALAPIERSGPKGRIYTASEREAIRTRIEGLLLELPKYPDLSDLEPVLPAVDPRERARLLALSVEALEKLRSEDRLGMAFVTPDALPTVSPSSSAEDVKVEGDEGTHTRHLGEHRATFPIVKVGGLWYLGVGRIRIHETR